MINIGLIGSGKIAEEHAKVISNISGIKIVSNYRKATQKFKIT